MARFTRWMTPTAVVAVVLVVGLLTAGSTALLKGAPGKDGAEGGPSGGGGMTPVAEERAPRPLAPPAFASEAEPRPGPVAAEGTPTSSPRGGEEGVGAVRLTELLSDALALTEAPDVAFADEDALTRGDLARAVVAALGLEDAARSQRPPEPIYRDVPPEHDAFEAVALLQRLDLYPFHVGTLFVPDEPVSWAEVRFTVDAVQALERVRGPVVHVNGPARTVSVAWTPRHATAYVADDGALIVRNGRPVSLEGLRPGDELAVVADADGQLFVAAAVGPEGPDGLPGELMGIVRELATPEQLAAVISRDWERAALELRGSVYNQLVERGATPEEAEALLAQDWPVVEERSKARVAELVVENIDVNEQLVRALLDGDWETVLGFLEAEVLEYVLNYLVV